MDPQVCFFRLMEAQQANDKEEFDAAFEDLATWLKRGGFPPVVSDLGWASLPGGQKKRREYLQSTNHRFAIMTETAGELGKFVFVIFNRAGNIEHKFPLRTAT